MTFPVRIRCRPPGATAWTVLTDPGSPVTIIAPTVIEWGRASGQSHADPGQVTLQARAAAGHDETWCQWDTEVEIHVEIDGAWILVGRCWIVTVTRSSITAATGAKLWGYQLVCQDIVGRAASTRLAADPWPSQSALARAAAVNTASQAGPLASFTNGGYPSSASTVAPRDVDNLPAIDVLRRTIALTLGMRAHELPDGVGAHAGVGNVMIFDPGVYGTGIIITTTGRQAVQAPATAIEDTGRQWDRGTRLDSITVSYPVNGPDGWQEVTETINSGDRRGSSSELRLVTDHTSAFLVANLRTLLAVLLTEGATSAARLPGSPRIRVDLLPPATLVELIQIGRRGSAVVEILDPALDLDDVQTVLAGRLTLDERGLDLALTLAPARLDGVRPLRWDDTHNRENTAWSRFEHSTPQPDARYDDTAVIRF